jgi:CBS domain-containing protein
MRAVAGGYSEEARVSDWMTRHPETVDADDATGHAASLMIHGGFRHLPVIEGDRVVGIISIRDLMRVALSDSSPRGV